MTTGRFAANPADGVEGPKRPGWLPKALEFEQLERIAAVAGAADPRARDPWPERDAALFAVFAGTGVRIGEVIALTVGSVEAAERSPRLRVLGKVSAANGSPTETTAAPFDPRTRRSPRPAVGGPPPRTAVDAPAVTDPPAEVGSLLSAVALSAVPAVGEGSGDDTRLPGRQRRSGSREIHVTISEQAYRLLEAARAERPGISYGDLVAFALVNAKPTLLEDKPAPPEDPLLRPVRTQRLHVEGRTRSRPFNVTPAQADAIRALADDAGIPNLSELVDRAVVLVYGPGS